ncbi:uncharacterized protein SEPMUDRAFT_148383 [Sphaerulina musiva SO2202]|uniref:Uncharacterized protein n=1 Tax=Sphaerulina musiva (strain SO2202) TaxID=692275 RepID=M3B4P2_SPHMS|nr:uncharacterized protein SEPMUDRAFT_148383 [Sphaerulina musiva SO2202]EMF14767.1 hypothetical protein SEPMUDRAFT_148383 [Sphaerulina musiva SO2202]
MLATAACCAAVQAPRWMRRISFSCLNASCSPLLAKSQRVFGHLIALLPGPSSLGTLWYSVSESLPGCVAVVGMTTGRINQVAIVAGAGPSLCEGNGRR